MKHCSAYPNAEVDDRQPEKNVEKLLTHALSIYKVNSRRMLFADNVRT
jgi:hypothetical protein